MPSFLPGCLGPVIAQGPGAWGGLVGSGMCALSRASFLDLTFDTFLILREMD